ncbi:integral membrane protein GPR180-like [Elysia marginata]|uniref:Integral membrane protein GPR180-like n=1 Tax=Elysia marginata TaxID=1093978 RepID=A0AAV4GZF0_9GAST|nr:integral membrane protein GPR180-like [Elysia marginata]
MYGRYYIHVLGLLKFYQLMTLTYFVVACVVAPQLWDTLSKGGPMQLVIQLLTCSMTLQFVAVFIIIIHFYRWDASQRLLLWPLSVSATESLLLRLGRPLGILPEYLEL